MDVLLADFSLFYHILFMLKLINDFLNFIEIMNWVFEIEVLIFGCENRMVKEMFGKFLKFMSFQNIEVFYALKILNFQISKSFNQIKNKAYF